MAAKKRQPTAADPPAASSPIPSDSPRAPGPLGHQAERIAADRWTLDQFVTKAQEIRRRLLRWQESLPGDVGLTIGDRDKGDELVRIVPWHQYPAICRETFRSRAREAEQHFVLVNPYVPGSGGPIERDGQFSSDQTEYVLRDFWEHLAGDPTLELLRVAFGAVLDSQAFSVHALGVPKGQTIGIGDVEPGVTSWVVRGTKLDPQLLNDFVEAAEKLAGPPQAAGARR